MSQQKSLLQMFPLFLVLFIDGMGLALLFPILNGMIISPHSHFLPVDTSATMRNFLYGFTVSIFMLCWFFGAAILGDLSDKVGRKKSLLICLVGACLGYFLSAVAVLYSSFLWLIVGRIIAGFTSGSQPIAQAAIVDVSSDIHKARNIGLILLAVSLGFVLGPILGGVLSDSHLYHGFGLSTPLYFAAVISLLNAFLLYFSFNETFSKTGKIKIRWGEAVHVFIAAFKHPAIRLLSVVFFIEILGWSNYFSFISLYMTHTYHFTTLGNSLLLAVMGAGFSLGFGVLMDIFSKRFTLKRITVVNLILTALTILVALLAHSIYLIGVMTFICGTTMALAYAGCVAIFSHQVGPEQQGWVMGVSGSIMALCFGLSTLLTGFLTSISVAIPLILALTFLAVSGVFLACIRVKEA